MALQPLFIRGWKQLSAYVYSSNGVWKDYGNTFNKEVGIFYGVC